FWKLDKGLRVDVTSIFYQAFPTPKKKHGDPVFHTEVSVAKNGTFYVYCYQPGSFTGSIWLPVVFPSITIFNDAFQPDYANGVFTKVIGNRSYAFTLHKARVYLVK